MFGNISTIAIVVVMTRKLQTVIDIFQLFFQESVHGVASYLLPSGLHILIR